MCGKKPYKSIKLQLKDHVKKVKAKCGYCGRSYDGYKIKQTIDHIIPKSSGGETTVDNLLVVCSRCNSVRKKSLPLHEFIKLNPKVRYFMKKYLNKMKDLDINNKNYYIAIKWIEKYLY
jgi:5-methylcytosine-specific restriction endonuclease McrA